MTLREIHFQPQLKRVGTFKEVASIGEIAEEQKLHSAGWAQAVEGQVDTLTGQMLERFTQAQTPRRPRGLHVHIDTRIHRLDVGQFPAVPGYHCDGWPRPDYHAQPDPNAVDARMRHWTGYLASDRSGCSGTEFVNESLLLPIDDEGRIWEQVHEMVSREPVPTVTIRPGELWEYGPYTLHRARPAHTRGWRLWFRLSWLDHPPENLIPVEDQVYVLFEGAGW